MKPDHAGDFLHLKGELSRAALRYAAAWQRHCRAETRLEGELDAAWAALEAAAEGYVSATGGEMKAPDLRRNPWLTGAGWLVLGLWVIGEYAGHLGKRRPG